MYGFAGPQETRVKLEACATPDAQPLLRRQAMKQFIKSAGLDVHKETIEKRDERAAAQN
jgi:hypothetical protein